MFSKKAMAAAGAAVLIALYVIVFSFSYLRHASVGDAATRAALFFVSPLQTAVSATVKFADAIWGRYIFLVSVARENESLKKELALARERDNRYRELELANDRLRAFVGLQEESPAMLTAARVIAKDASPWYNTMIINKGAEDGVQSGCPVVVPEGIVGLVLSASRGSAKVLLIIDRNSSVDALVQRTRDRGIVQGQSRNLCRFDYFLRKLDVQIGDVIVSSGFDGIYPKGLLIGTVSRIIRRNAGLFQEVELNPSVDFSKLEEVMVILPTGVPNPGPDL